MAACYSITIVGRRQQRGEGAESERERERVEEKPEEFLSDFSEPPKLCTPKKYEETVTTTKTTTETELFYPH